MHLYPRVLTGLAAAFILILAVNTASAARLSISNRNFRVVWAPLTIRDTVSIRCNVTFEGSTHTATINKTAGSLIGYISAASAEACTRPATTGLGMPWHIKYVSFAGALPNITAVRVDIIEATFLVRSIIELEPEYACLYRSTAARPLRAILNVGAGGRITSMTLDNTLPIPLSRQLGGFPLCETEITVMGTGTVTLQGTATAITLSLI